MTTRRARTRWIAAPVAVAALLFCLVDLRPRPPVAVWLWGVADGAYPERDEQIREIYERPAGARVTGFVVTPDPPRDGAPRGVTLRALPDLRARVFAPFGLSSKAVHYEPTTRSEGTDRGVFWELRPKR